MARPHEAKLTPIELKANDCRRLIEYRIGLTDLAKHASGMDQDLPANCFDPVRLRQAIQALSPIILAFNGKKAAGAFFGVGTAKLTYGRQKERIGKTTIYVCPQTSAANAHWSPDPWHKLARDLRALRAE